MRKLFIYASIILTTSIGFVACSSDDDNDNSSTKIEYASLPTETRSFLESNLGTTSGFSQTDISYIEFEKDGSYEVKYRNGVEIDFYSDGIWRKIDLDDQAIPDALKALIPAQALAYINEKYPNYNVDDIEKKSATNTGVANIEIELDGLKYDIVFDYQGNLISDPNNTDFPGNNNQQSGTDLSVLPTSTQEFLKTYLPNKTNPKIEVKYFKYGLEYNEDQTNEFEIDFYKDGSFMSVATEENNAENITIIENIIKGITGSDLILQEVNKYSTTNYLEDFSVVSTVAGASCVVKLEGIGKNVDYKIYFDTNSKVVLTIMD